MQRVKIGVGTRFKVDKVPITFRTELRGLVKDRIRIQFKKRVEARFRFKDGSLKRVQEAGVIVRD